MSGNALGEAPQRVEAIVQAYVAEAKPPLTPQLTERLRAVLAETLDREAGIPSGSASLDQLNAALDGFEIELSSVVGPRVAALDEATGSVTMRQRSEAGQPLRSFGGQ